MEYASIMDIVIGIEQSEHLNEHVNIRDNFMSNCLRPEIEE